MWYNCSGQLEVILMTARLFSFITNSNESVSAQRRKHHGVTFPGLVVPCLGNLVIIPLDNLDLIEVSQRVFRDQIKKFLVIPVDHRKLGRLDGGNVKPSKGVALVGEGCEVVVTLYRYFYLKEGQPSFRYKVLWSPRPKVALREAPKTKKSTPSNPKKKATVALPQPKRVEKKDSEKVPALVA